MQCVSPIGSDSGGTIQGRSAGIPDELESAHHRVSAVLRANASCRCDMLLYTDLIFWVVMCLYLCVVGFHVVHHGKCVYSFYRELPAGVISVPTEFIAA